MDKIHIEEQIDRFILNEMAFDERRQFVNLMNEDEELRAQVAIRYSLMEGMLQAAEQKVWKALEKPAQHQRRLMIVRWAAIACVILLIGGGVWFGNSPQYTSQEVYSNHCTIPVIERSRGGNGLQGKEAAINEQIIQWYEEGNYFSIAKLFGRADIKNEFNVLPDYTLLYACVAFLKEGEADVAIPILMQIENSEYQEEADWLLLCCYLQNNERQKAIGQAEKIQISKGQHAHAAQQIEWELKMKRWF